MNPISLYTKKIQLEFNDQSVAIIDLEKLIEEVSRDYDILDAIPAIAIHDNFQYVTFKVSRKKESKGIGFNFGKTN